MGRDREWLVAVADIRTATTIGTSADIRPPFLWVAHSPMTTAGTEGELRLPPPAITRLPPVTAARSTAYS